MTTITLLSGAAAPATLPLLQAALVPVVDWLTAISAMLFGLGSLIFASLLYRDRIVPRPLAGLGMTTSILITIVLPLHLIGAVAWGMSWAVWVPILVFQIVLGLRLLTRGAVSNPVHPSTAA